MTATNTNPFTSYHDNSRHYSTAPINMAPKFTAIPTFVTIFCAALAVPGAAQTFATSGDGLLNGDYFVRQVVTTDLDTNTSAIGRAVSLIGIMTFDQGHALADVGFLSPGQDELDGVPQAVDSEMQLGPETATRASRRLVGAPFFAAPAACWWARITVLSRISHSRSGSCSASNRFRQRPARQLLGSNLDHLHAVAGGTRGHIQRISNAVALHKTRRSRLGNSTTHSFTLPNFSTPPGGSSTAMSPENSNRTRSGFSTVRSSVAGI